MWNMLDAWGDEERWARGARPQLRRLGGCGDFMDCEKAAGGAGCRPKVVAWAPRESNAHDLNNTDGMMRSLFHSWQSKRRASRAVGVLCASAIIIFAVSPAQAQLPSLNEPTSGSGTQAQSQPQTRSPAITLTPSNTSILTLNSAPTQESSQRPTQGLKETLTQGPPPSASEAQGSSDAGWTERYQWQPRFVPDEALPSFQAKSAEARMTVGSSVAESFNPPELAPSVGHPESELPSFPSFPATAPETAPVAPAIASPVVADPPLAEADSGAAVEPGDRVFNPFGAEPADQPIDESPTSQPLASRPLTGRQLTGGEILAKGSPPPPPRPIELPGLPRTLEPMSSGRAQDEREAWRLAWRQASEEELDAPTNQGEQGTWGAAPAHTLRADISLTGPTPDHQPMALTAGGEGSHLSHGFAPMEFAWTAPGTMHQPLYFEDVNLERAGHSWGLLQPAMSAVHFFGRIPALPYLMATHPPGECVYTLGHYRPGSCAPQLRRVPRLKPAGGLVQAGVVTGLVFLVP